MDQLSKNTVEAKNQLKESQFVTFERPENQGVRIMFAGNSITLHGYRPEIGWHGSWGMAASAKDRDYVHLCISETEKYAPDAAFCICQISEWEREYKNGSAKHQLYRSARDFNADIIVMRAVENCPAQEFDEQSFVREYDGLLKYLNPEGKAKIIITSSFWKHPADPAIEKYAKDNGLPYCCISDLGELDEMKAIGLFEHEGVAQHPGDLGMETISKRIMDIMADIL